jgi:hypothetical protein
MTIPASDSCGASSSPSGSASGVPRAAGATRAGVTSTSVGPAAAAVVAADVLNTVAADSANAAGLGLAVAIYSQWHPSRCVFHLCPPHITGTSSLVAYSA